MKYRYRDCAVARSTVAAPEINDPVERTEAWWIGNEDEGAKVHHDQRGIRLSAVLDVDREKRIALFTATRGAFVAFDNRIVLCRSARATREIFEA